MREAEVFLVFLHMYFSLLIREGQHFGTRTVSSNESQELLVGQFVVSSQHMVCYQLSAAQTLALSEPCAPYFTGNDAHTHILPLSFHKTFFNSSARDSAFLLKESPVIFM